MKFSIITVEELTKRGFDITSWRKSNDGLYALVHTDHIDLVYPELIEDSLVYGNSASTNPFGTQSFYSDSTEFTELLSSEEWKSPEAMTVE